MTLNDCAKGTSVTTLTFLTIADSTFLYLYCKFHTKFQYNRSIILIDDERKIEYRRVESIVMAEMRISIITNEI